jgi:hypothetical protein
VGEFSRQAHVAAEGPRWTPKLNATVGNSQEQSTRPLQTYSALALTRLKCLQAAVIVQPTNHSSEPWKLDRVPCITNSPIRRDYISGRCQADWATGCGSYEVSEVYSVISCSLVHTRMLVKTNCMPDSSIKVFLVPEQMLSWYSNSTLHCMLHMQPPSQMVTLKFSP